MDTMTSSPRSTHPVVVRVGALLVAVPLIAGAVASLMALAGRFGGGWDAALTAFWYVAAALAPAAIAGAALLLVATRRGTIFRGVATWSGISSAGWVFGLVSARWSGLADAQPAAGVVWPYLLLGSGIAVYLVGLVGVLLVVGRPRPRP
jgi:hypothetical protein